MTKELLPTTHNAERGARSTCREEPETGPSLEASEHQRDRSRICLRRSLHVIFKMVYMKELGERLWRYTKIGEYLEQY